MVVLYTQAFFIKFQATTTLAFNSIELIKKERLNTAKEAYNTFRKKYPVSEFDKKAENLLEKIEKELQNYTEAAPQETK